MLYFFYGTDTEKARARARGVLAVMKKKRPDAEYFRVTADTWNKATLEGFVSGQGLFERKFIVFADWIFDQKEAKEWVAEHAGELGASDNAFVFLERSCDAATLRRLTKAAREVKHFDAREVSSASRSEFKIFALADALGRRDRKELWALLSEAFIRGLSAEEVNGVLFWQAKAIALARDARSAGSAGLSPFVYLKSKRYSTCWSAPETVRLLRLLVSLYHDAHRGRLDFAAGLERLALSL